MLSDGYNITASWLAPVAAPEPPWRQSNMDWKVQDQNAPSPADLWIADMAIKDYEVSACLRKGLSHSSTHMH